MHAVFLPIDTAQNWTDFRRVC